MHQMTVAEHRYPKSLVVQNSLLPSFCIHFWNIKKMDKPQDKPVSINMLSVTDTDGSAFNTRSQTHQCLPTDNSTSQPDITADLSETRDPMPKTLTANRLQALLQVQKTDPFCKGISKHLSNGKVLQHETELLHISKAHYINM